MTGQRLLPVKPKGAAPGAGSKDQSPARKYTPVRIQGKAPVPGLCTLHCGVCILSSGGQCLIVHPLGKLSPGNPVDSRIIFHQGRIDDLSPVILLLQHQGAAPCPGSIQRRCQSRYAPSCNQHIIHVHPSRKSMPISAAFIRRQKNRPKSVKNFSLLFQHGTRITLP